MSQEKWREKILSGFVIPGLICSGNGERRLLIMICKELNS